MCKYYCDRRFGSHKSFLSLLGLVEYFLGTVARCLHAEAVGSIAEESRTGKSNSFVFNTLSTVLGEQSHFLGTGLPMCTSRCFISAIYIELDIFFELSCAIPSMFIEFLFFIYLFALIYMHTIPFAIGLLLYASNLLILY